MKRPRAYITAAWSDNECDKLEMSRTILRKCDVLVVCGNIVDDIVKSDIAYAERRPLTATTLDGILTVKGLGRKI